MMVWPAEAQARAAHPAVAHQPRGDVDAVSMPIAKQSPCAAADHRGVDADHPAVAVRPSAPPELPGLSGASVWMTLSISRPLGDRKRAAERADDAGGHGCLEAQRVADRDHQLADPQPRRASERRMRQARRLQAQDGKIGGGIVADAFGIELAPVGQAAGEASGPGDHMAIGEEIAVGREQHARAGAGPAPAPRHGYGPRQGRPSRTHARPWRNRDPAPRPGARRNCMA